MNWMNISLIGWSHLGSPIVKNIRRPRLIETFPSKQMCPYLSLVERKVAEFYHNIDKALFGLVRLTYFHQIFHRIAGVFDIIVVKQRLYNHVIYLPKNIMRSIKETCKRNMQTTNALKKTSWSSAGDNTTSQLISWWSWS